MDSIDEKRDDLSQSLNRAEKWLTDLAAGQDIRTDRLPTLQEDVEKIGRLRTRASSALINVALLGGFSSGKSFLLSGLQRGLTLTQVASGEGSMSDKYVGLLPSAPVPTTACPASVVPVNPGGYPDATGRGFLRVRFTDSDDWEEIGHSPSPVVVGAYATEELVMARLEQHWSRTVTEIEILLSDFELPAKLYDLPGWGSPNPYHEQVVKSALADADCFIYVAHATPSLSEKDLELIRELHNHHLETGRKKVVWVLTAIDRTMDLGLDNRPAWKATIDLNNRYLRENFALPDGGPDLKFVGQGFIPVSPALEARGRFLIEHGDKIAGQRLLVESRMQDLRDVLVALIKSDTGPRHIAAVAQEARRIVVGHHRVLVEILEAEQLDVNQLASQQVDLRQRIQDLGEAIDATRTRLEAMLVRRIRTSADGFDGLSAHLHAKLDDQINAADLRSSRKENQIDDLKNQYIHDWVTTPTGPWTAWEEQCQSFKNDALGILRGVVADSVPVGALNVPTVGEDRLTVPKTQRSRSETLDVVQRAAGIIGGFTPIAGGVAALLGILSAPMLAVPGAIAGGAALVYGGIAYRKHKATSVDLLRREWIAHLDEAANQSKQAFVSVAGLTGSEIIDRAEEVLSARRDELVSRMLVVQERMASKEIVVRQDRINKLEPQCHDGSKLLDSLTLLTQF